MDTVLQGQRKIIKMPAGASIAAGNTATFDLPIGHTYHKLYIQHTADITVAEMTRIALLINGRTVMEMSGANLDKLNVFEGKATDAARHGCLILDFEREMRTVTNVLRTSIGTGYGVFPNIASIPADLRGAEFGGASDKNRAVDIKLEIDIAAGAEGANATDLGIYAEVSNASPLGVIKNVYTFNMSAAAAGVHQWRDLSKKDYGLINKIAFIPASDVITHLKVIKNQHIIFESPKALIDLIQPEYSLVPQTGMVVYYPAMHGFGGHEVATADAQDFNFELTVSGASAITALVETIAPMNA